MSLKRKFASGAAWNVAGMSFDQLASFVIFVTLSRILSPKEFGLVALASIFVEMARPIVARGASDALIQRSEWNDVAASTAFWMNLLLCCVVAVLILAVGALFMLGIVGSSADQYEGLGLILVVITGTLILDSMTPIPMAKLRRDFANRQIVFISAISTIVTGTAGILLAVMGWGIWALVIQRVLWSSLTLSLTFVQARWRPRLVFDRLEGRRIAGFMTGLTSSQLLSSLNGEIPGLLVGYGIGPVPLAHFRAASRMLTMVTQFLISPVQQMSLIAFSQLRDKRAELPRAFERVTGACAIVACPVFMGLGAIAPDLVAVLFGAKWAESAVVLRIGSLIVGVLVINYFLTSALASLGKTRNSALFYAFMVASNSLFGLLALPWGLVGVVLSQIFVGYLEIPIALTILKRDASIRPLGVLSRVITPFLCSLGMAAIVILVENYPLRHWLPLYRLLVLVPLGCVLYGAFMFVFARPLVATNVAELEAIVPQVIWRRLRRLASMSA
jgi:O-antigen/teichoic acid export membrane protein